jgi:Ser/Thr protein kinase RdoA (MazF antagonist)
MELSKQLGIGKIHSITFLKGGFQNTIYRIKSEKGDFCLRLANWHDKDHVLYEALLLARARGPNIPDIIKVRGSYVVKVGSYYGTLYRYIPGKHRTTFSKSQLIQLGKFLAQYHKRTKGFTWPKPRYEFYNIPDKKINLYVRVAKKAKLKYLNMLPGIVADLKHNRLNSNLPKGPIHVDIGPRNVLFYKGNLSGVLDFDNSYIGPLILDLGKTIMFFASRKGKFDIRKALIIYKAYAKERKLSKQEYAELYKAIKFAFLSHVFVDYYIRAIKVTPQWYFEYIVNDLYKSYKAFNISENEFYMLFK